MPRDFLAGTSGGAEALARRKPKLLFALARGKRYQDCEISEDDWQKIGSPYGTGLSADVRSAVLETRRRFLDFEVFERTAEPVDEAEEVIEEWKRGASEFRRALHVRGSGAALEAAYLVKSKFRDIYPDMPNGVETLSGQLAPFIQVCDAALADLKDQASAPLAEGRAWRAWIRRLAQVLRKAGLKVSARQDKPRHFVDRQSPFVEFVWVLQCCLPAGARYMNSKGSLASAINAALRDAPKKSGSKAPRISSE